MPQDEESYAELRHLAAVPRQIISPANNSPIVGIFQDSLLSSFRISRPNIEFNIRDAMNILMSHKSTNLKMFHNARLNEMRNISNFELLTQILPPLSIKYKNNSYGDDENAATSNNIVEIVNGVMKRGQFDKSVKKLLQIIFNDFGHEACADFIDDLQNIVTSYMMSKGFSVGISDLIADKDTNSKIADSITRRKESVKDIIHQAQMGVFENSTGKSNIEEFESVVNSLLNEARSEAGKIGKKSLDQENRFVVMTTAGSKGSDINIAQMISCLGQQNVDGKRIPYGFEDRTLPHYTKYDDSPEARGFVENSFIQGLTPQELFFHAMGGRVGLIDTAVKTAQSGYIQRRLIKGMEDLKVEYDMTVRNNMGKIIQFQYGDDSVETTKVEGQSLPLVKMSLEEIYGHFDNPSDDLKDEVYTTNFTKQALTRMNRQKEELRNKTKEMVERVIQMRDDLVENVFKGEINNRVNMPVNITRIMGNIQKQLHIHSSTMVDITPLECYNKLEQCKNNLNKLGRAKPSELFFALMDYYMCPKELLVRHRFHKDGVTMLMKTIVSSYMKSIVSPGEMVGMIAAQSIGEPTTQMSCISSEKMRIVSVHKETGEVAMVHQAVGDFCDELIKKHPTKTFNTGHEDSVETLLEDDTYNYYIVGVSVKEKTSWNKISHVSRHPINGKLLRFRTRSGRSTITTASHSHLRRDEQTQLVVPIRGDELRAGMRIPVCRSLTEDDTPATLSTVYIGEHMIDLYDYINQRQLGMLMGSIAGSNTLEHVIYDSKPITFHSNIIFTEVSLFLNRYNIEYEGPPIHSKQQINQITITDERFIEFMKHHFVDKQHEIIRIPKMVGICDTKFISSFLLSFLDTSGYIHLSRKFRSIRIINNNVQVLFDIAFLLNKMGIFSIIHHNQPKEKQNELIIQSKYVEHYVNVIGTTRQTNMEYMNEIISYHNKQHHTLREDVDLIPGVGKLIARVGKLLSANSETLNCKRWNIKPHMGRRTLVKYLNVFESLPHRNLAAKELTQLKQAAYSDVVWDEIISIEEVPTHEKEYVYDLTVPGNETFMNDQGLIVHNTLNTFHSAGISSKSNVTRGVPRIEEILSLTKSPKNPSMTVHLKGDDAYDKLKAQQMKYLLEYTCLNDIVKSVSICFDPDNYNTLIEEDHDLVSQFMEFERITKECMNMHADEGEVEHSKWILRFEMNKDNMLDRNISMDDVHYALKHGFKEELQCVYSDYNADKLIMRLRMRNLRKYSKMNHEGSSEFDQSDDIYALKNIQDALLHNVVLKGVHDIPNVNIRKLQNQAIMENGNYVSKDKWVLDTVGTNLLDILAKDDIDVYNSYTNDIIELHNVLGIEATRQIIYDEIAEVIEFDGTYINYHHMSMLCDRMCCKHNLVSIYRHGITNDDIGPIAKASFEQTPEMFLRAARHGEVDNLRGVSAAVMTGQMGNYGTSSFQVVLDMDEIMKQDAKTLKKEEDIDELFEMGGGGGEYCSLQNISKRDNVKLIGEGNIGDVGDDDYDLDF